MFLYAQAHRIVVMAPSTRKDLLETRSSREPELHGSRDPDGPTRLCDPQGVGRSYVTCFLSYIGFHMSCAISCASYGKHRTTHVLCHISFYTCCLPVIRRISDICMHVTYNVYKLSFAMCHVSFFIYRSYTMEIKVAYPI